MKTRIHKAALLFFGTCLMASSGFARDRVHIAGSSTVFPYAKFVADSFHETYPQFKTPLIESGGSGAGIKEFCRSADLESLDVVNASRPMKKAEIAACFAAGVKEIEEIRFGYDGIVFASDIHGPDWSLTPEDLYKAFAAKIMVGGKLVANPIKTWQAIDKKLPDTEIMAYVPGEKHGTREVFEEKVMLAGCRASGAEKALQAAGLDEKAIKSACIAMRKDGRVVDIDGDYSETLARLGADKKAVGVFGLAFYENNMDRLKVAAINAVVPSAATVASGQYPISRPLYFYVKKAHLGLVNGLKDYIAYFLSDAMIGPEGEVVDQGLVAAPAEEREKQRAAFQSGQILKP